MTTQVKPASVVFLNKPPSPPIHPVFWAFVNSIPNPREIVSKVFFIVIILSFNQNSINPTKFYRPFYETLF